MDIFQTQIENRARIFIIQLYESISHSINRLKSDYCI